MKTTLDEYIRASFMEATKRAIDTLAELARYNQSDSPPFSQVHGLQRYIDELQGELTEEEAVRRVGSGFEHMTRILMDTTLQSEAWDGAPIEMISEARAAWKYFIAYLKLARKSVLAASPRILTRPRNQPSTQPADSTVSTIRFERPIGEVYYRTIGQKRWRKWKDATEEVALFGGHQYQLRVSSSTLPFRSPRDVLGEIDLDAFEEIVAGSRNYGHNNSRNSGVFEGGPEWGNRGRRRRGERVQSDAHGQLWAREALLK